jgi:hypothetical protein
MDFRITVGTLFKYGRSRTSGAETSTAISEQHRSACEGAHIAGTSTRRTRGRHSRPSSKYQWGRCLSPQRTFDHRTISGPLRDSCFWSRRHDSHTNARPVDSKIHQWIQNWAAIRAVMTFTLPSLTFPKKPLDYSDCVAPRLSPTD